MSNVVTSFLNSLRPRRCFICERRGAWLCADCAASLPRPAVQTCVRCGLPTQGPTPCGACLRRPPAFDCCHAAMRFSWPMDSLIHAYKYHHRLDLAAPLAQLMLDALSSAQQPQAIIAMPMSTPRLRQRGFNQAHELARQLARHYHVPLLTRLVSRQYRAPAQAELPLAQRAANVRKAFTVQAQLPEHIAIVDDVMTSGSSMQELAHTLRGNGARHIQAWLLARTYPYADM